MPDSFLNCNFNISNKQALKVRIKPIFAEGVIMSKSIK